MLGILLAVGRLDVVSAEIAGLNISYGISRIDHCHLRFFKSFDSAISRFITIGPKFLLELILQFIHFLWVDNRVVFGFNDWS